MSQKTARVASLAESGMSALGQKQTCASHRPMSAKCQKRTSPLFDNLVGSLQQRRITPLLRSHSSYSGVRPLVQDLRRLFGNGNRQRCRSPRSPSRLFTAAFARLRRSAASDRQHHPVTWRICPASGGRTACRAYAALSECAARLMPEEEEENDDRDWNAE